MLIIDISLIRKSQNYWKITGTDLIFVCEVFYDVAIKKNIVFFGLFSFIRLRMHEINGENEIGKVKDR